MRSEREILHGMLHVISADHSSEGMAAFRALAWALERKHEVPDTPAECEAWVRGLVEHERRSVAVNAEVVRMTAKT